MVQGKPGLYVFAEEVETRKINLFYVDLIAALHNSLVDGHAPRF
jgi:hypothetical protein